MSPVESFTPRPAVLVRHRALFIAIVLMLATGVLGADAWSIHAGLFAGASTLLASTLGPMVLVLATLVALLRLPRDRRTGLLEVTEGELRLDRQRIMTQANIREAFSYAGPSGPVVRIRTKTPMPPVDVQLHGEADAEALLQALAQSSRQATVAFTGVRGGSRRTNAFLAGFMAVNLSLVTWALLHVVHLTARQAGFIQHSLGVLLLLDPAFLAVLLAQMSRVVVGADGVRVRRLMGKEFYPFSQIRDARRDGPDVVLDLASGRTMRVLIGTTDIGHTIGPEATIPVDAAVMRINEGRARSLEASPSDLAAGLARGERDVRGWVESVRALIDSAASYRRQAVPRERYWAVLEDPTQPATARAGAAVALRVRLEDGERARMRVAKKACASRELEGALEAALESDDEGLERALRSLRA